MSRLAYAIVKRLPVPLIKEPERVFIATVGVVFGVIVMVPGLQPPSLIEVFTLPYSIYGWAVAFLIGGISKLIGLNITTDTSSNITELRYITGRNLERLGALLIGGAAGVYGIAVLVVNGNNALLPGIIFLVLSCINFIRLIVSTVGRATIIEEGMGHGLP